MALTDRTDAEAGRPAPVLPGTPLPPLPASLWESREVREAVRDQSPGAVVAVARKAHGLRQDELGALAGFSQSAVSRLESGSNIAYDLRVLRPLQRLLGIPAHLLGLADHTLPVEAREVRRPAPGLAGTPGADVVGADVVGVDVVGADVVGAEGRSAGGVGRLGGLRRDRDIGPALAVQRERGVSAAVREDR